MDNYETCTYCPKKLEELNFSLDDLTLGDFDLIGEWCCEKNKEDAITNCIKQQVLSLGPNYERGLIIYALILEYDIKSFLEIGFWSWIWNHVRRNGNARKWAAEQLPR